MKISFFVVIKEEKNPKDRVDSFFHPPREFAARADKFVQRVLHLLVLTLIGSYNFPDNSPVIILRDPR